jgi:hypothetical protein
MNGGMDWQDHVLFRDSMNGCMDEHRRWLDIMAAGKCGSFVSDQHDIVGLNF